MFWDWGYPWNARILARWVRQTGDSLPPRSQNRTLALLHSTHVPAARESPEPYALTLDHEPLVWGLRETLVRIGCRYQKGVCVTTLRRS